jgi:Rrf2 family protein
MKLLSRNTDYAVRALCYIACQKEKTVSVTELVKALKIPRPFLRKILQVLNRKGVLESHKGVGGGFRLAKSSARISVLELMEAFQGRFRAESCFLKKEACPNKASCPLKKKISAIEDGVYKELKNITIGSIIKGD